MSAIIILIDNGTLPIQQYIPNIFFTSVDLAKQILGTLAGALLTITTFTFSTILIVLTMYSSQFSPRVVDNFLTNKITMKVLGLFVGVFYRIIKKWESFIVNKSKWRKILSINYLIVFL